MFGISKVQIFSSKRCLSNKEDSVESYNACNFFSCKSLLFHICAWVEIEMLRVVVGILEKTCILLQITVLDNLTLGNCFELSSSSCLSFCIMQLKPINGELLQSQLKFGLSAVCIRNGSGYCVVAEAGCNLYLRDINIHSLSKKKQIGRAHV